MDGRSHTINNFMASGPEPRHSRPSAMKSFGKKIVQYAVGVHKDKGDRETPRSQAHIHNINQHPPIEELLFGSAVPRKMPEPISIPSVYPSFGPIEATEQYPQQARDIPSFQNPEETRLPPSPVYTMQSNGHGDIDIAPLQLSDPGLPSSLDLLKKYQTIVLIDDSQSMYAHRQPVHRIIQEILPLVVRGSTKPIEVQILSDEMGTNKRYYSGVPSFEHLWKCARFKPDTSFQAGLGRIINPKIQQIQNLKSQATANTVGGLNVICITDGNQSDKKSIANYIQRVTGKLDERGAEDTLIGIQFLQVGDSQQGAEFLNFLDNNLRGIDIVDTVKYSPSPAGILSPRVKVKMVLGAIHKSLDDDSNDE
ncbi:hypothetical protein TWF173_010419 [Orbilia oligospora]|nr:hypothetical protein TWF173_010419 [Orbilia oligospora]